METADHGAEHLRCNFPQQLLNRKLVPSLHHKPSEPSFRFRTSQVAAPFQERLIYSFFQGYGHCVARIFPDRFADVCPHGQFMSAITECHKRTPKRMPIDLAPYLYQTTRSKKLD